MADLGSLLGAAGIGGAIGKAIVQLELDTGKYQAEMRAAQAQTTASANTMGSSWSRFGGLASTALLGAGAAAVAFGAFAVKAAVEANEAHLKLSNTFDNNARLADSSVEAFERQADALRELTGVDDEAIISAQALLGQFKLTGAQVQELIPLIVDLSAKMGIDLDAAAKAVGKATQGSAGILSRYGIILDETALKTDAFAATVEGLGVAQGFAAERAEAEPWRVLGSELEELAEEVGQNLLPPIIEVAKVLVDLAENLSPVLDLVGKLGPAVRFLGEAFEFLLSPLAKVIPLIASGIKPTEEMNAVLLDGVRALEEMKQKADIVASSVTNTREKIKRFANMSAEELEDFRKTSKEAFDGFVFDMERSTDETRISQREFARAFDAMRDDARRLNEAMRRLKDDDWVNDRFLEFLTNLGPEFLIRFSRLNEEQQRKWQQDWKQTNDVTDNTNKIFDQMIGKLDKLDKGESRHKVFIEYEYIGFDPSKPGMAGSGQTR